MQHAFCLVPHECCTARACVAGVRLFPRFSLRSCGSGWLEGAWKRAGVLCYFASRRWSSMENELKSYHNKKNWLNFVVNFVWMQNFWMLLKLDNTSWRKTLRNSFTISFSCLSWIHSSKRRRSITTKRVDQKEHQNWDRIGVCNLLLAW